MSGRGLNSDFLSDAELSELGVLNASARNIMVHSTAVVADISKIEFTENIRIDPYCVISCATLKIGRYVHIGSGSSISGAGKVILGNLSTLSHGTRIFTSNDLYDGTSLTNPTVPREFCAAVTGDIKIGDHVIIGSGTVVLPGVMIGNGASVGALSLVRENLSGWGVFAGVPTRRIGSRSNKCEAIGHKLLCGT